MTPILPCDEFKLYYSWYCCLAPLEHSVLTALIALRAGAFIDFITKANFDSAWTIAGGTVGDGRYGMFVFAYYLRLEIVDFDGAEIPTYFMDNEWWFKWLLFVGCPTWDATCTDCFELTYGK